MATQTTSNTNWRPFVLQPGESKEEEMQDDSFSRPDLRLNVFVSKEATSVLARMILPEPWGPEFENLYKLIDYTWRAALFEHQVFEFTNRGKHCLVFHSGLQRRMDGEFIYFVLVPNDDESKVQKWRMASSPTVDWSFQTAGNLLQHVDGDRERLPKPSKFYDELSELMFDSSAVVNVDWVRMMATCGERIIRVIVEELLMLEDMTPSLLPSLISRLRPRTSMKDVQFAIDELQKRNYSVPDVNLIRSTFSSAFQRTKKILEANPQMAVPQGFVDTHKQECRLDLLFPLFVDFDVGVGHCEKISMCFCVALQKETTYNGYKGMSVLTAQMGYTNARLIGLVHQSWLLAAAWPDLYKSPLFTPIQQRKKKPVVAQPIQDSIPAPTMRVAHSLQQSAPPNLGRYQTLLNRVPIKETPEETLRETRSRSLFVRNIPPTWNEHLIRQKFAEIGVVNRVTMLPNRIKGSDKLLCLIEMKTASDAVTAIHKLHNNTDENGLKVEQSRPRPARRPPGTTTAPSVSTPPSIGSQKLTLQIQNVGHHQTASTFLELLKFADVEEDQLLWIVVHQPENYALIRFRTADQIERAYRVFVMKSEFGYMCKKIRNPNLSEFPDESFWKIQGGDRLPNDLSAQLDETKNQEWFLENPDDGNSAKIMRHTDSLGSRSSPNSQASVPLIRVERTSWRAPNRWLNSRLRRPSNNRTISNEKAKQPKSPSREMRSTLNPNAVVFNPDGELREEIVEEFPPFGANFVPHDRQWDVLRGTPEWNQLEHRVSSINGLDVMRIVEWTRTENAPTQSGLLHRQVWMAGSLDHIQLLETEGLLIEYGNGRGRRKGFDVFVSPNAALAAISMDVGEGGNLLLCDVFLNETEQQELAEKKWVRVVPGSGEGNGRVERIIPKFVYHTSFRRVGR